MRTWSSYPECSSGNWLYDTLNFKWTITPYTSFQQVFTISNRGNSGYNSANYSDYSVIPVVYLSSNTKIVSGIGTTFNPFQLSVN